MQTLEVELGDRSYPIHIGSGLLENGALMTPYLAGKQSLIVTNETVAPLYLDQVRAALGTEAQAVVVPDGERFKSLETANQVYEALLRKRYGRQTTLVALGGGVVGDLTGFVAATYQRGVAFIQIPTTLLAQVDSSVGGKTAVNHPLGKNMIGAFHQPRCVIADTDTLTTLPDRELKAGLAEVIKYGLIRDKLFFSWLENNVGSLSRRDATALTRAIEQSCRDKAEVVAADEREHGERALLNLGHTFGHAIETATGYTQWLHGEAVAAGMCMAASMSTRLGWLPEAEFHRIEQLLAVAGLPIAPPSDIGPERFRELMGVDKKNRDGRLRLILLQDIGRAVISDDFPEDALTSTLERYSQRS